MIISIFLFIAILACLNLIGVKGEEKDCTTCKCGRDINLVCSNKGKLYTNECLLNCDAKLCDSEIVINLAEPVNGRCPVVTNAPAKAPVKGGRRVPPPVKVPPKPNIAGRRVLGAVKIRPKKPGNQRKGPPPKKPAPKPKPKVATKAPPPVAVAEEETEAEE